MKNMWRLTNGIVTLPLCETCVQPIHSGHVNCCCPTNHPQPCRRPTYDGLVAEIKGLRVALGAMLDIHCRGSDLEQFVVDGECVRSEHVAGRAALGETHR